MPRHTIDDIKLLKNYYRDKYRLMVKLNLYSLIVTICLTLGLFYMEVTRPPSQYFASNSAGAGFISELTSRATPNSAAKALLKPDPPEEMSFNRELGDI